MRANYDTRTLTVQAGTALPLPPAREYLLISATVSVDALSIAIGDGNADFSTWPSGFAVGVEEGTTIARVRSTVTQTIVIAMVVGNATMRDNRLTITDATGAIKVAPFDLTGYSGSASTMAALASSTYPIVAAVSNVSGIIVHNASLTLQSTVANGGRGCFLINGVNEMFACYAPAGVVQTVRAELNSPVKIPAGQALEMILTAPVAIQVGYACMYDIL